MPTTTAADGTELFIKDWGEGPAMLFVHSAAVSNDIWQYQHAHFLEAGYRVVAFDRRGHGRSGPSATGFDADTLADDLARVIEARGLTSATLVGHSMGCGEIVRYLAHHGAARVSRIILAATTTPFLLRSDDNRNGIDNAVFAALRAGWRQDYPRWVAENARPFFVPETSQAVLEWAVDNICQTPVTVAIACNKTVAETDYRADCRAIAVPTLIVHGTLDVSAPLDLTARPTAALITESRLEIYEGAPHGLMFTHMERLHADMQAFMRSC